MRLLAILLLCPSLAFADWSNTDIAWEAAYMVAMTADCLQARDMDSRFKERNPFLGEHPSKGKIDNACLVSAIGHPLISYALPKDLRRIWQVSTVAIEVVIVRHQYQIGLKLSW